MLLLAEPWNAPGTGQREPSPKSCNTRRLEARTGPIFEGIGRVAGRSGWAPHLEVAGVPFLDGFPLTIEHQRLHSTSGDTHEPMHTLDESPFI